MKSPTKSLDDELRNLAFWSSFEVDSLKVLGFLKTLCYDI